MISRETIIEFQVAVKEEYDKQISFEEATEILTDLVMYFDVLAKMHAVQPNGP